MGLVLTCYDCGGRGKVIAEVFDESFEDACPYCFGVGVFYH